MKKVFVLLFAFMVISGAAFAETVVFNVKTLKYHKPTCKAAKQCTVNCIRIEKEQAKAKGGKPCKMCGG